MSRAIEVLEKAILGFNADKSALSGIVTRQPWEERFEKPSDKEELLVKIANLSEYSEQCQTAIDHLKRKVKKDPNIDGLPESNKYLIVWLDYIDMPFIGVYHHGENPYYKEGYWLLSDYHSESNRFAKTDEILFYCDPNEIP